MRYRTKVNFDSVVLIGYLKKLDMNATYYPPDFSDGRDQVAMIELTTTRGLQEDIIHEINFRLNELNGFEAGLRIIDYGTSRGGQIIHYAAEIVPRESLKDPERKTAATDKFLKSLPKAIRNLRHKYRK